MASSPLMNPIQELNFSILQHVRDAARSDLVGACCRFGLTHDQLRAISELTPADVLRLVARMGDEALFAPREDLASLLSTPTSVLPLVAASRRRVPAKRSPESTAP
jgi:Flagellar transcriptional activator (FlhD)